MRYLQDIGIGLEEPTVLVVAELLKAPTMGEFAREGFVDGWKACGYAFPTHHVHTISYV
jgi:DCN1-like protein 1/2